VTGYAPVTTSARRRPRWARRGFRESTAPATRLLTLRHRRRAAREYPARGTYAPLAQPAASGAPPLSRWRMLARAIGEPDRATLRHRMSHCSDLWRSVVRSRQASSGPARRRIPGTGMARPGSPGNGAGARRPHAPGSAPPSSLAHSSAPPCATREPVAEGNDMTGLVSAGNVGQDRVRHSFPRQPGTAWTEAPALRMCRPLGHAPGPSPYPHTAPQTCGSTRSRS
jgi:hypothetical protein